MLPKVTIVTATYGRLDHFRKLVESIRAAFPKGAYEIIAVSSDPPGSEKLEWLYKQPDVAVTVAGVRQPGEHRRMSLYALENMGIKAASGDWVFVTNDDTEIDIWFYSALVPIANNWDVIMVNGHIGEVGLGRRTAVIGDITPPNGPARPLYLYDFTLIRKSVYERIGWLDESLDWFGKGFDLAMACETVPGIRVCYGSDIAVNHAIADENRRPPHYARDFSYATQKWLKWCDKTGWSFSWPW